MPSETIIPRLAIEQAVQSLWDNRWIIDNKKRIDFAGYSVELVFTEDAEFAFVISEDIPPADYEVLRSAITKVFNDDDTP
jgi:hypothetical protein